MTNKEILENNRLIAKFMNVKNIIEFKMKNNPEIIYLVIAEDEDGYIDYVEGINYILYHSSWDWLMPVIEKIENLNNSDKHYKWQDIDNKERSNFAGYEVIIDRNKCKIWLNLELDPSVLLGNGQEDNKLLSTYKAVTEFIKYYNEL